MFPDLQVECYYQESLLGNWDVTSFQCVAGLCEKWLLRFTKKEYPGFSAYHELLRSGANDADKRRLFALGMACCAPSERSSEIFAAFRSILQEEVVPLSDMVDSLSSHLDSEHPIDVLKGFQSLPDAGYYGLFKKIYSVNLAEVRTDAIAWGDLDTFQKTLIQDGLESRLAGLYALAAFPSDSACKIHQALIKNDHDAQDLFFLQFRILKNQVQSKFNNGVRWQRMHGGKKATLSPDSTVRLEPPLDSGPPWIYETKDFSDRLRQTHLRCITEFFIPPPNRNMVLENYAHISRITQVFLNTGLTASYLITHGVCDLEAGSPLVSLDQALEQLFRLDSGTLSLCSPLYNTYLKDFDPKEIVSHCKTPEQLAVIYQIRPEKAFLELADERTRDRVFGSDLGL